MPFGVKPADPVPPLAGCKTPPFEIPIVTVDPLPEVVRPLAPEKVIVLEEGFAVPELVANANAAGVNVDAIVIECAALVTVMLVDCVIVASCGTPIESPMRICPSVAAAVLAIAPVVFTYNMLLAV